MTHFSPSKQPVGGEWSSTIGEVKTPLSLVNGIYFKEDSTVQDYYDAQNFSRSTQVVCVVNGDPLLRKHWKNRVLTKDDRIAFVIVPAGRTFKAIVSVVLQIAALVFLTPIIGTAGAAAVAAVIGAVFNLVLMPKPPRPEQAEESPTYSSSAQGNQARLLQPIPRGYGYHKIVPDFAAQPYTTFINNEQYLYQLFCLGVGEYDVQSIRIAETEIWSSATGYDVSFEGVEIEICPPGTPVTLFPTTVQTSTLVAGADLEANVTLGPYVVNESGSQVNSIAYDVVFPRGLFAVDKKGKITNRSVKVRYEYRPIDDTGAPAGMWQIGRTATYTRSVATAQRFTEAVPVPLGRYEARVVRLTEEDPNNNQVVDKVQWHGLRGFQPSDDTHDDVTMLAVKIKATNQLTQQSSRQFNVIQTAKIPIWDGTTWSAPTATQSIAWAVADMLRNPVYGEGRPDSLIDLAKLLELDATWSARGDTFNGVFDTKQTFWEAMASVLAAGRAQPMLVAGICTFTRDEPRALPKGAFTPANIVKDSFGVEHILYGDGAADDIIVEFFDERTWTKNEVQCSLPGSSSENPVRISLFGVTNRTQAWREGMYQAASNMYRRVMGGLTAEMEGKLLTRGDVVQVAHDLPQWGASAEVEDYDPTTRTLTLSEDMEWVNGPFEAALSTPKGGYWGTVTITEGNSPNEAIIDASSLSSIESSQGPIANVIVTDPNRVQTRFLFATTTQYTKRFIVTSTRPRGMDKVEVALVNDDARVYTADTGTPPAETSAAHPGTDPNAPTLSGLEVTIDPAADTSSVIVNASWAASAGANNYVAQMSVDGNAWVTVYEGHTTSTSFVAQPNILYVRVAAIGVLRGPWTTVVRNLTDPENAPSPVTSVNISISNGQSQISADWDPAFQASSYLVEIVPLADNYELPQGEQPYVPPSIPQNPPNPYRPGRGHDSNPEYLP